MQGMYASVLWNKRYYKPKEKVDSILRHTQEGVGLRKTSRLEKVNKNTVGRYIKIAGKHAYKLHEELVAFSPLHTKSSVRWKMGFCLSKREK